MFRRAAPARPAWNLTKTLVQIVVLWTLALAIVPWLIDRIATEMGIARFHFAGQRAIGLALFGVVSAANVWAGVVIAWWGEGTPLPLDTTHRLVVRGPYAFVRNPMAIGGLAQGAAVGLAMGSWPVMAYALAGGLLWNYALRPLEEADMAARYGAAYEEYRRHVRCWIPRLKPYRPEGAETGAGRFPSGSRGRGDSGSSGPADVSHPGKLLNGG